MFNNEFLEIAPVTLPATISGKQVEVGSLSLQTVANLIVQHPGLMALFDKEERATLKPEDIAKAAPAAITEIILHGLRLHGNKKAREIAQNLPFGEQMSIISKVIKLSMPGGFGPFVEELEELTSLVGKNKDGDSEQNIGDAVNQTVAEAMSSQPQ